MLLSRVADSLYWISRYLERAEHTARLVDVAVDSGLGRASSFSGSAVERLYQSIGLAAASQDVSTLAGSALFELANRSSVVACVMAARENARQVREEISSAMWEQLNALFLRVQQMREEGAWGARTHHVSRTIIDGVRLFKGITDGTMGHGEGWQYLQVGRFLERSSATASLLDPVRPRGNGTGEHAPNRATRWSGSRCCGRAPRSRRIAATTRRMCAPDASPSSCCSTPSFRARSASAAVRLEGALRTLASYSARHRRDEPNGWRDGCAHRSSTAQVDEILSDDPQAYLVNISRQCSQIHRAVQQSTWPTDRIGAAGVRAAESSAASSRSPQPTTCATPSATSPASPTSRPSPRA